MDDDVGGGGDVGHVATPGAADLKGLQSQFKDQVKALSAFAVRLFFSLHDGMKMERFRTTDRESRNESSPTPTVHPLALSCLVVDFSAGHLCVLFGQQHSA